MGAKKRETLPSEKGVHGLSGRGAPVALRVIGTGREVVLPVANDFDIGSDHANHLVLDDHYVSGFHCSLERVTPTRRVLIRDRQSRNGTYVNGIRVHATEVDVGARIQVGSTTLALLGDGKLNRPAIALLEGTDPAFRHALDTALRAADSEASVLITGESGTGKELVARLIHESSPRSRGPFVPVNCSAIPRDLVESELFGHERGAFTGAHERRIGVFEQADGGTLFLDEIGDLPVNLQPRLLRVLETRKIRRVGGQGEHAVDVRVVAATHRALEEAPVSEFRLDLYHRLCGIEVRLPALRERLTDVPRLIRSFLDECAPGEDIHIDAEALDGALRYDWPGNVRELKNAVQRAAVLGGGRLQLRHLIQGADRPARTTLALPAREGLGKDNPHAFIARETVAAMADPPRFMTVDELMKTVIERALTYYGTYRRAAQALGLSKSSIYDKARQYGVAAPRRGRGGEDEDDAAAPDSPAEQLLLPGKVG